MRILTAYITKDLIVYFLTALLVFTFFLFLGSLLALKELAVKGIDTAFFLKYILFGIPFLLSFSMPMSILTATLLIFGRLSSDNEITAMRACGISIFRIFIPPILVAVALTLLCVIINDTIFAECHYALRKLERGIGKQDPGAFLEAGRTIDFFPGYDINIERKDDKKFHNVFITEYLEDGKRRFIKAKSGKILPADEEDKITLELYNGTMEEPDPDKEHKWFIGNFGVYVVKLSAEEDIKKKDTIYRKYKDRNILDLMGLAREYDSWTKLRGASGETKHEARKMISEVYTEIQKRLSLAFSCLAFVIIALPLGVKTHRTEKSIGVAMSLLLVAFYQGLIIFAKAIDKDYHLRPYLFMWLPNVILIAIGIILIYRISRK